MASERKEEIDPTSPSFIPPCPAVPLLQLLVQPSLPFLLLGQVGFSVPALWMMTLLVLLLLVLLLLVLLSLELLQFCLLDTSVIGPVGRGKMEGGGRVKEEEEEEEEEKAGHGWGRELAVKTDEPERLHVRRGNEGMREVRSGYQDTDLLNGKPKPRREEGRERRREGKKEGGKEGGMPTFPLTLCLQPLMDPRPALPPSLPPSLLPSLSM